MSCAMVFYIKNITCPANLLLIVPYLVHIIEKILRLHKIWIRLRNLY